MSSEESDDRISGILLDPELGLLSELNIALTENFRDEQITMNVIWFLSNLVGERRAELTNEILRKTEILDYMLRIITQSREMRPIDLRILPWLCSNFMNHSTLPQHEVVS